MNLNTASLPGILERLRRAKRVAIFTHLRPDPDALGSQAAAACILAALGATKIHRMDFATPPAPYRFLQENIPGEISTWDSEWAGSAGGAVDTILLVDTCTYQQLEPAQNFLKAERQKIVAIDHHLSRDDIGAPENLFTDHTAASCTEILCQLATLAKTPITQQLALPLFAGIVGDTGWFRFDSVTKRTHELAATLSPFVNPAAIYERLMQTETRPKLGLMQRALASLRWSGPARKHAATAGCSHAPLQAVCSVAAAVRAALCKNGRGGGWGGQFACMLLRFADFTETGATQAQTEYLVDMPMIVATVEIVALLTEMSDGRIRCSLRSKHDIDVNKICNQFDGGGHAKAAGCRLDGPMELAYEKLSTAIHAALPQ